MNHKVYKPAPVISAVFKKYHSLELLTDGTVITCSRDKKKHRHILIQSWPELLPWMAKRTDNRIDEVIVTLQNLPDDVAAHVDIRSVFAIFFEGDIEYPVLITREPLPAKKLKAVLRALPPVAVAFNKGKAHVTPGLGALTEGL